MPIKNINAILNSLHDATLVSIEDNVRSNSSKLILISEDEKVSTTIYLHGIRGLRCTNWKIGNIVLDASVLDIQNPINKKRVIDLIIYTEELNKIQIQNKKYLPILNAIESSKLFIFELNPSYGAYFVGIVENITFEVKELKLEARGDW